MPKPEFETRLQKLLIDGIEKGRPLPRMEAIMVAATIEFAQNSNEFLADYGTFGRANLAAASQRYKHDT